MFFGSIPGFPVRSLDGCAAGKTPRLISRLSVFFVSFVISALGCRSNEGEAPARDGADGLAVVSLVPSVTDLLVASGGTSLLVGRTDFDTARALSDIRSVGGGLDPNLETLAEIAPDLVLMARTRDQPVLGEQIERLGIEVRVLPIESVAHLRASLDSIGLWFGLEHTADSVRSHIDGIFSEIAAQALGFPVVRVAYVVWPDPPMVAGSGTFIDELIDLTGAENVFSDLEQLWPSVSLESIVARNPDIVVWPTSRTSGKTIEDIRTLPGWSEVPAVRQGRVALVDSELFGRPGPNVGEAAKILFRALYQERTGVVDP